MKENYLTIIPAAGRGLRAICLTGYGATLKPFINATERGATVLEEIVRELERSGLNDLAMVVANEEDENSFTEFFRPFDRQPNLESDLEAKKKFDDIEFIKKMAALDISYFFQRVANGFGDAIAKAQPKLEQKKAEGKPYAGAVVALGDDMIYSNAPGCEQMISAHKQTGCMIVGVQQVTYEEAKKFGVVLIDTTNGGLDLGADFSGKAAYKVTGIEEKPKDPMPNIVNGNKQYYAILGRYVLNEGDINFLSGKTGTPKDELDFTTLFKMNIEKDNLIAVEIEGDWLTVGSSLAAQKAAIKYGIGQCKKGGELGSEGKQLALYAIEALKENGIVVEEAPGVYKLAT